MIKLIIASIILFSVCLLGGNEKIKFESIEFPNEITLSKNVESLKEKTIVVKYNYIGERLIPVTNRYGKYSCSISYIIEGRILYKTGSEDFLPRAYDYYKDSVLNSFLQEEVRTGSVAYAEVFDKDRSQEIEINLFDPFLLKRKDESEVFESIQSARIKQILLIIKNIEIYWELNYPSDNSEEENKKGKFKLRVNKTIEINIKYENQNSEKPRSIK